MWFISILEENNFWHSWGNWKMPTIFTQIDIIWVKIIVICEFWRQVFSSQLKINHVIYQQTSNCLNRCRPPRQTKYEIDEYHMISIAYWITLQLKKDMSCLLNVCASFEKKFIPSSSPSHVLLYETIYHAYF